MAKAMKKSFVFNCEWAEVLADYSAEIRLEVYEAVIRYAASGTLTELRPLAKMAFSFIKKEIDYNNQRYDEIVEKRSAAGRKGIKSRYSDGNKKDSDNLTKLTNDNKTNKSNKCYHDVTNLTDNDNVNDNDNDIITPTSSRNNSMGTTNTTTGNDGGLQVYSSYIEESKCDGYWMEVMCMNFHLTIHQVTSYMDEFRQDCLCRGVDDRYKTLQDFKQHFNNWLRIKTEKERQNHGNRQSNGAAATKEQRQAEAAQLVAEILARDN